MMALMSAVVSAVYVGGLRRRFASAFHVAGYVGDLYRQFMLVVYIGGLGRQFGVDLAFGANQKFRNKDEMRKKNNSLAHWCFNNCSKSLWLLWIHEPITVFAVFLDRKLVIEGMKKWELSDLGNVAQETE